MREILFRGKRMEDNLIESHWVYGSVLVFSDYAKILDIDKETEAIRESAFVPIESLGQYTGITDISGAKIFEGDIIKGYGATGKVEFEKAVVYWDDLFSEWRVEAGTLYGSKNVETYEIIGNITDNPELLKEGNRNETSK